MNSKDQDLTDRVEGVLYGVVMGDLNLGPQAMACILCQSFVEFWNNKKEEEIINYNNNVEDYFNQVKVIIFKNYLHWKKTKQIGSDDTGRVGHAIFKSISDTKLFEGLTLQEKISVIKKNVEKVDKEFSGQTAGINPAHRNVVLCMIPDFKTEQDLMIVSEMETLLTHHSSFAIEVSQFHTWLCKKLIINGITSNNNLIYELMKEYLQKFKGNYSETFLESLEKLLTFENKDIANELPLHNLSMGGFSPETLQAALYFIIKHTSGKSIEELQANATEIIVDCIKDSFKFAGGANFCPVLLGPMLGAMFGKSKIPKYLLEHSKILDKVEEVCKVIVKRWETEIHF
ncbi:hypothetical protein ABK040_001286 [Willaertia magna]